MSHLPSNGAPHPGFGATPAGRPALLTKAHTARPTRRPPPTIHELLPRVMRDIGAVGKHQYHEAQAYHFRSIDDALNAVQPVLVKHRVSVSFNCFDQRHSWHRLTDGRGRGRTVSRVTLMLELTLWAPDGSSVTSTAAGEGCDEAGDKATGKAMACAMKYALFYGLLIPVAAGPAGAGGGERAANYDAYEEPPARHE